MTDSKTSQMVSSERANDVLFLILYFRSYIVIVDIINATLVQFEYAKDHQV